MGQYILGQAVRDFEGELKAFTGAKHAITCGNGTDALQIIMMAKDIGPGDAVFCPAFTFTATPEAIALLGATPVLVDVDPASFNIDPATLEPAIALAKSQELTPRAIVAVDLFGQAADYDALQPIANAHDMWILGDAAQGFGASLHGKRVGTLTEITSTSFFPAKPLGCYGDGGAIFTDNDDLAAACNSIRVHGKGTDKYDNVRIGVNSRLDTLQAAILSEKLAIFEDEIVARNKVANHYGAHLSGCNDIVIPRIGPERVSVWAQYVVRLPHGNRDAVAATLKEHGIATAVYYPKPLHHQTAYRDFPFVEGSLGNAESLCGEVLALPMHPYLSEADQGRVCETLIAALA